MNLANLLLRTAKVFPLRPAVALGDRELYDYRELARRAGSIARGLREYFRLTPGERVALCMTNCPQYLEVLYGVWHAGLVAVPINSKLHTKEVSHILEDCEASMLFITEDVASSAGDWEIRGKPMIVAERPEYIRLIEGQDVALTHRSPEDLAWLFYTSGTTGKPKGVMLTHRNLLAMTLCYFPDVDQAKPGDSFLYAAPMSHGAGMYNFPHVLVGARHLVPESGGFEAAEIFRLSKRYRNVSMFAAPTMVRRLVDHAEVAVADSSGIKTIVYGGGPMYLEDIRRGLDVMGERFVQIYGQGESPMTITALSRHHLAERSHPRYLERIASVGVAHSTVEVRVVDAYVRPLPAGESGEVLVRGDTVMLGYWRNRDATSTTLRDGWLWTGDIGSMDEDGFLTLRDRSKDVIISGGSNIYPREVEEVLLKHPAVQEVSVVGRSNEEWGEDVMAFVVCRPGESVAVQALDTLCLEHIARFKRPKDYIFIDALPKNNYGKVLKTELRARLAKHADE